MSLHLLWYIVKTVVLRKLIAPLMGRTPFGLGCTGSRLGGDGLLGVDKVKLAESLGQMDIAGYVGPVRRAA